MQLMRIPCIPSHRRTDPPEVLLAGVRSVHPVLVGRRLNSFPALTWGPGGGAHALLPDYCGRHIRLPRGQDPKRDYAAEEGFRLRENQIEDMVRADPLSGALPAKLAKLIVMRSRTALISSVVRASASG